MTAEEFHEKPTRIIQQIKEYQPQRVILFGSFARGEHHGISDKDLSIVKDTDRLFLARIGDVLARCDCHLPLEPLVYTPRELEKMRKQANSFIEAALREGVVVHEQQ